MLLHRHGCWLTAACLALVLLGIGRYWTPVRVAGQSMRPALMPGDLCLVASRAVVAKGDIALVRATREGRFLHRVIAVETNGAVRTKGDANAVADFKVTPRDNVIGPVVRVVPVGALVERWRGRRALRYTFRSSE